MGVRSPLPTPSLILHPFSSLHPIFPHTHPFPSFSFISLICTHNPQSLPSQPSCPQPSFHNPNPSSAPPSKTPSTQFCAPSTRHPLALLLPRRPLPLRPSWRHMRLLLRQRFVPRPGGASDQDEFRIRFRLHPQRVVLRQCHLQPAPLHLFQVPPQALLLPLLHQKALFVP